MIGYYIKAARLRTLPLSISGIIVGSFMAASQGSFHYLIFILALATTICLQIISNFANDYGDGVKGTDNEDRIGPERAVQSGTIKPKQLYFVIKASIIITFLIAALLIYVSFGSEDLFNLTLFLILGVVSIIAAIKYTMGKKAYGYSGFGDLFVFLFFGLLSVMGSHYLYVKYIDYLVLLPAISIGFLSMGVLNLNNMRDRESDLKSGKNTLVVKLGPHLAKYYHYALIIGSFLAALLYTLIRFNSVWQFVFVIAYIPIGIHLYNVVRNKNAKLLDPELKKLAVSTFLFALLFGLSLFFKY